MTTTPKIKQMPKWLCGNGNIYSWLAGVQTAMATVEITSIVFFISILESYICPDILAPFSLLLQFLCPNLYSRFYRFFQSVFVYVPSN